MLVRVSPGQWPVCPGDDIVYQCTVNGSNLPFFFWEESSSGHDSRQIPTNSKANTTGNFAIEVISTLPIPLKRWVVVSTATLRGALLSHNNLNIGCRNTFINGSVNKTVMAVAGLQQNQCTSSYLHSSISNEYFLYFFQKLPLLF